MHVETMAKIESSVIAQVIFRTFLCQKSYLICVIYEQTPDAID